MASLDLTGHFSLTSSEDVKSICDSALKTIGLSYFNYIKIHHKDGSRELLTNNAEWIDHFYKNGLYESAGTVDIEHLLPKGYFLWQELDSGDPIYGQGRDLFNIDHGASFVVKHPDVTYLYIFATTRDNQAINNFYSQNIDLFKRFMLYFNDKAENLIKEAENNRIYLPTDRTVDESRVINLNVSAPERKMFYEQTKIDKFYLLNESSDIYLTKKQAECSAYLLAGATAKQCAKKLGLSYRTVESYINDIKNKFIDEEGDRPSKEKLLEKLRESGIEDTVFEQKIKMHSGE